MFKRLAKNLRKLSRKLSKKPAASKALPQREPATLEYAVDDSLFEDLWTPADKNKPQGKRKMAVIGAGSAGILSLIHFCTWLDTDWEVYCIYNPSKPILGIGESTNGEFVGLLERGTDFCLGHQCDLDELDATLKYGSKFMNWREQSWINPLLDGNTAVHFNNFYLKDYAFKRLEERWPDQFRFIEGNVDSMADMGDRVVISIDDVDHDFDYVIDCMGFPQDYSGYVISDCTPVNRCLIHNVTEFDYEPFTDHIATPNGWMFGVPLQSRKTYGYMYNDRITSKEDATEDMKRMLGIDELEGGEYKFKCYYTPQLVNGRIFRNGNKALFFEPLVANSIAVYTYAMRLMYDYMMGVTCAEKTNANFMKAVQNIEDVISYYYMGGSTFESEFWTYATHMTKTRMDQREAFKQVMANYRSLKQRGILHSGPVYGFAPRTWELVDKQMGYGLIEDVRPAI